MKVIFRAVFDLDNEEEEILRDDDEELCYDQNDKKIRYKIKDTALHFLSGKDRALKRICDAIGVNAQKIIDDINRLGPIEFKRLLISRLTQGDNSATNQL